MNKLFILLLLAATFMSCSEDPIPKPKGYLNLSYAATNYQKIMPVCGYSFEISEESKISYDKRCWAAIEYPNLKASVLLTYRPVTNNLKEMLLEAEKMTFEHTAMADAIHSVDYVDEERKVYATIYNVEGNAASNIQFKATDSNKHVLRGALYFNRKPNYDSIQPAVRYLEKDIIRLVETLEW